MLHQVYLLQVVFHKSTRCWKPLLGQSKRLLKRQDVYVHVHIVPISFACTVIVEGV